MVKKSLENDKKVFFTYGDALKEVDSYLGKGVLDNSNLNKNEFPKFFIYKSEYPEYNNLSATIIILRLDPEISHEDIESLKIEFGQDIDNIPN